MVKLNSLNRLVRSAGILAGLSALIGCSTVGDQLENARLAGEQNVGLCPNVFALEEAARMIEFSGDPALENVAWSAEIVDVRTSCRFVADRPIRATVEIDFAVGRGPAAVAAEKDIHYFVAVTRRNRELIAKAEYAIPTRIRGDIATVRFTEDVDEILIPRKDSSTAGTNFEIAVGFALTRDQVIFNRSGQSLKFPNL